MDTSQKHTHQNTLNLFDLPPTVTVSARPERDEKGARLWEWTKSIDGVSYEVKAIDDRRISIVRVDT